MDAEVAAIMCNLALVRKGSVVLDPCVGTGSILVAAAAAGAHVMGCDIDLFALVGRPWCGSGRSGNSSCRAGARGTAGSCRSVSSLHGSFIFYR